MQSHPDSFFWSEDFDQAFNFWVWLHVHDGGSDAELLSQLGEAARQHPFVAFQSLSRHHRWPEFSREFAGEKARRARRDIEESRTVSPQVGKEHYEAVASVGLRSYRVQWVMAPLGARWLLPPGTAVLGDEVATPGQRRKAVLEAARSLRAIT